MNTLELMEPEQTTTPSSDAVYLPYGLLGFERVKNYTLLSKPEEAPFLWLQMREDSRHAFLVLPPSVFLSHYQPNLEEQDTEFLEFEDPADVLILTLVTVEGPRRATANLKGPLFINRRTWIGKQIVPNNAAQYPVRLPLALA